MSIETLSDGEITVVSPAELRTHLDEEAQKQLDMHFACMGLFTDNKRITYFEPTDHEKNASTVVDDPYRLLGDTAVKSVTLSYQEFGEDIAGSEPINTEAAWSVSPREAVTRLPYIRFFIAKAAVGGLVLTNESREVIQSERRTFAAVAVNPEERPRETDIRHVLKDRPRHAQDTRGDVVIAPTSISRYAWKPNR